jgi:molybdopterin synthase catalytic subunit
MNVKLFATLKDRAGANEISLDVPYPVTVRELRDAIARQYPNLAALAERSVVSINREFAFNDDRLNASDEVALFPPVSGGGSAATGCVTVPTIIAITPDPIDLNALQRAMTTDRDGAVVIFTGTVRGQTGAEHTTRLNYEAYADMAHAKLDQVADEIRAKFALVHGIALVQRVGEIHVGEPTVAVAVSAGHRGDGAFEAARYGIDRLKQIVPVWKKETRLDGSSWIEGDYVPVRGD